MSVAPQIWVGGVRGYWDIEGVFQPYSTHPVDPYEDVLFEGPLMGIGGSTVTEPFDYTNTPLPSVNDAAQIQQTKQRQSLYLLIAAVALFFVFRKK